MNKGVLFLAILSLGLVGYAAGGFVPGQNCSCVAFRLDDIQDYWISAAQMGIINLFKELNVPLTVGVIANYFGTDSEMVNFIKGNMNVPGWEMEIVEHGFNHEDFTTFTLEQQTELLRNSTTKIQQQLGVTVKTFIPPFNSWNQNTITALQTNGYTRMSSEVAQDPPPYALAGQPFYHFPIGAQTSDPNDNGGTRYVGIPAAQTWSQIQSQLGTYGFSAVMMHPMEFSVWSNNDYANQVNTTQMNELRNLINTVKASGLRIVVLGKINTDSNVTVTTGTTGTTGARTTGTTGTTGVRTTGTTGTTGVRTTGTTGTTGVQPPVTTGVQPVVTTGVQPIVTTGVQPPVTTGVQPPVTTGVQPIVTTGEQPVVTTGEQPVVTTGTQPEITSEEPSTTAEQDASTTGVPDTTGDTGDTTEGGGNIQDPNEETGSGKSNTLETKWIILIVVLGGVAVLAALVGMAMYMKSRMASTKENQAS